MPMPRIILEVDPINMNVVLMIKPMMNNHSPLTSLSGVGGTSNDRM